MLKGSWSIRIPLYTVIIVPLVSMAVGIQAGTWYVRPDGGGSGTGWGDALSSFKAAIAAAAVGDEIWGASGVYNESLTLKAGIALYGGFAAVETVREERDFAANPTILDAAGLNQRVITANRIGGVTIDGFTIRNGYAMSSAGGIYFNSVSSATVSNCTISANTGSSGGGVSCRDSSSVTITNCTISSNGAAGHGGGVFCLSSSPTLTHCTISDNMTSAGHGGGVACLASSPTLTHCTISDNAVYFVSGGGVSCEASSSPRLTNCTISGNRAFYGAGVWMSRSSPMLNRCTISGNTAGSGGGGVYCINESSPSLTYCTISGNSFTGSSGIGGGVYCRDSSPLLTNCMISANTASTGGGVYCQTSSPRLTNCAIMGNRATGTNARGGGVYCSSNSSPTLTNCAISGNNTNRDGAGIHCNDQSSPTLTNCTIAGNTSNRDGNGVTSFTTSSPTLINCVLWNGGDEVFVNSANAEVTFSAVQGGYPGQGNIDEDPMFVDPEQSDYRLALGSPCIDSGSTGVVLGLGPSVLALGDHDGRMRIWDGDADGIAVVDMGAYEFGPPPFVGDIFGDLRVNHMDLFRFQQVWREEGEGALPEADQDGDRTIGPTDLTILLHVWGAVIGPRQ